MKTHKKPFCKNMASMLDAAYAQREDSQQQNCNQSIMPFQLSQMVCNLSFPKMSELSLVF